MNPANAKKLKWRCRRGMRELDVMLERYLDCHDNFEEKNSMEAFERFLESSDMDIYEWVTKRSKPSNLEFATIVDRVLAMK
jgi:antitoxin CptB